MKRTEFWYWMVADEWGRQRRSVCRFTEADAIARDPQATRIEGTCEVRMCPETLDEIATLALDTGGFIRATRERLARELAS